MSEKTIQQPSVSAGARVSRMQNWGVPALLRRRTFAAAVIASLLAALYWGLIASDRYVSEAHIIVQQTNLDSPDTSSLSGLLGGFGANGQKDELLLRDYLLSDDILRKLDAKLHLREHYSDHHYDILSRMWSKNEPWEWFYRYYLSRVNVDLDDTSGVLVIQAQAYTKDMAHAIVALMVEQGEAFMNDMEHRLAQGQVEYLEKQVTQLNDRATAANQALLDFQNKNGLVSPESTAENLVAIVNQLQAQLADLKTRRSAMLGYLTPKSPAVTDLDLQIGALEKQISQEQARLASPGGGTLNRTVEEYQRLQMTAEFSEDLYKTALTALEKGRVDATRMLKKVSVVQAPTKPDYPLEPRRIYNTIVFALVALLIAGIVHLLAAIVRDHKD